MENNLIYDYITQEKVVISYTKPDQIDMIYGLMGVDEYKLKLVKTLFPESGFLTFDHIQNQMVPKCSRIYLKIYDDHILLTADEFFTLALPNKSILEFIK